MSFHRWNGSAATLKCKSLHVLKENHVVIEARFRMVLGAHARVLSVTDDIEALLGYSVEDVCRNKRHRIPRGPDSVRRGSSA